MYQYIISIYYILSKDWKRGLFKKEILYCIHEAAIKMHLIQNLIAKVPRNKYINNDRFDIYSVKTITITLRNTITTYCIAIKYGIADIHAIMSWKICLFIRQKPCMQIDASSLNLLSEYTHVWCKWGFYGQVSAHAVQFKRMQSSSVIRGI